MRDGRQVGQVGTYGAEMMVYCDGREPDERTPVGLGLLPNCEFPWAPPRLGHGHRIANASPSWGMLD